MADDPGPPIGGGCDWCGKECHLHTAPVCPDCHGVKPGDLIGRAMERMLTRRRVTP